MAHAGRPVLNAGNGAGEHPTQALLDVFTIRRGLARRDLAGLTIVFVGDLKHGRTVHSLAPMLATVGVTSMVFVSPAEVDLAMPTYVVDALTAAGVAVETTTQLTPAILGRADVMYVTRVQKERFATPEQYAQAKGSYVVDAAAMSHCKPAGQMILMHPLPRVDEIATEVDADPRAWYIRQMRCGLIARMALLTAVVGGPAALARAQALRKQMLPQ
jgi:aspartate carbamoyltransferase